MTLGEMLIEAKRENLTDLEALIGFLVFEKKVHSLKDEKKCLDKYYLSKHKDKMNRLLTDYKQTKNLKYKPSFYMIIPQKKPLERLFVIGYDAEQVREYLKRLYIEPLEIQIMLDDELILETMTEKNGEVEFTYKQLNINDYKTIPAIIGKHERTM